MFVRLRWKSLQGTNTLTYHENSYITLSLIIHLWPAEVRDGDKEKSFTLLPLGWWHPGPLSWFQLHIICGATLCFHFQANPYVFGQKDQG